MLHGGRRPGNHCQGGPLHVQHTDSYRPRRIDLSPIPRRTEQKELLYSLRKGGAFKFCEKALICKLNITRILECRAQKIEIPHSEMRNSALRKWGFCTQKNRNSALKNRNLRSGNVNFAPKNCNGVLEIHHRNLRRSENENFALRKWKF